MLTAAGGAPIIDAVTAPERYGLSWPGAERAWDAARQPPSGTLLRLPDSPVGAPHAVIEGDNLEVLRVMQRAYAGTVKLAFLDPPYNTGGDFVYPDDYRDPVGDYLRRTGQVDGAGFRLRSDLETAGRHHSNWLSMMLPRLVLLRDLLRPDGFLFVTIDDHEVAQLRLLLDRVFGESNFLASIIWEKTYSPRMDAEGFSGAHEYVLAYRRSPAARLLPEPFEQSAEQFNLTDEQGRPYRRRSLRKEGHNSLRSDAPAGWYPLTDPDGGEVWPFKPRRGGKQIEGTWRMARGTYDQWVADGLVEWVRTARDGWQAYKRQHRQATATRPPTTLWRHEDVGHTHEAAGEVAALLGPRVFDTPKPTRLLRRILRLTTAGDDLVVDPFAGSGTTGDAVLRQNADDGGQRRALLIQLPHPTGRPELPTLAAVCRARMAAAATAAGADSGAGANPAAIGHYALAPSALRPWDEAATSLDAELGAATERLDPARSLDDLALECQLVAGVPLHAPIDTRGDPAVTWCGGLALALGPLDLPIIDALCARQPDRVVLRDAGFPDEGTRLTGLARLRQAGAAITVL